MKSLTRQSDYDVTDIRVSWLLTNKRVFSRDYMDQERIHEEWWPQRKGLLHCMNFIGFNKIFFLNCHHGDYLFFFLQ
jgi:hypothetical protein